MLTYEEEYFFFVKKNFLSNRRFFTLREKTTNKYVETSSNIFMSAHETIMRFKPSFFFTFEILKHKIIYNETFYEHFKFKFNNRENGIIINLVYKKMYMFLN